MEKEFIDLAKRVWNTPVNLYEEINKIRLKYPIEVRRIFYSRYPSNPSLMEAFTAALMAADQSEKFGRGKK